MVVLAVAILSDFEDHGAHVQRSIQGQTLFLLAPGYAIDDLVVLRNLEE
jgi:hypothetical protein